MTCSLSWWSTCYLLYGADIRLGTYYHTWAAHLRAVALSLHRDPIELIAAKTQKAFLIHFNIALNYGYGLLLPNSMVLYLHSQTSILKNSKSHNPPALSGFISLSWLYLFDYCVIMNQLPWCSPSFVLFCWFVLYCVLLFLCKDMSTNVKVSALLYQYGFSHHATISCVPI